MLENKNYISVVGLMDKKIVSFVFGFFSGGVYNIQWVGVNKDIQKTGVGTKTLQKLFGYCKTKNCHKIIAGVVTQNKASLALFRGLSFHNYTTIYNYYYHKDFELFQKNI